MQKKITIGITCYPSIGGSGIVATELGNELAKRGHEVHFISYEKPFRLNLRARGIFFHKVLLNEYELFKYPDYTLPLAVKMGEIHEKFALDILHVHYAVPHATAALLACQIIREAGGTPPRVITTLHGTDITLLGLDPNLQPIINYSINRSCGITAVSQNLKDDTNKTFQVKKEITVIYNFFQPKKLTESRDDIRQALGVKEGELLIIHSSNLRAVKRIPDLLRIVAIASKKTNLKLLLLSGGDFTQYKGIARQLNMKESITIKENVVDIENYLNASDIALYPSETESFGMGILEAMCFGKPVIASRAGGIPEVVEEGKTGLLYPVGYIKGFASGLLSLAADESLRKKLGIEAQKRAKTFFSAEVIVGAYLNYYQKILTEP